MATAAVNLAFGASSSMAAFCTLWGINGMLQVRTSSRGSHAQQELTCCSYSYIHAAGLYMQ
jgi:sugar phosphate permease